MNRRDLLKSLGLATAATAAGALSSAQAVEPGATPPEGQPQNPYGGKPNTGITLPPYYRPTPSVKNANTFFSGLEELGDDEMRISFIGSTPVPPTRSQAGTCIMVECGKDKRFFFDFGSGALKNLVAMQVPIQVVNDIFFTHLHVDHLADLPYLYAFAPWMMRWKPLRVYGPSGRTEIDGIKYMIDGMKRMCHWHTMSFNCMPVGDGYEVEVNEFDFKDNGGICYNKDGVVIRHWQRAHGGDGCSGYRLDWKGLSFVWTGDGRPEANTVKYSKGVDVFVTEGFNDTANLGVLKFGLPTIITTSTVDMCHTPSYATGYMFKEVQPRLAMVTHTQYDETQVPEMVAEIRTHWDGLFAFGAPDVVVVNVTKDAIWTRKAALPEETNFARPSKEDAIALFDISPTHLTIDFPNPKLAMTEIEAPFPRSEEYDVKLWYPPDVYRKPQPFFPKDFKIDLKEMAMQKVEAKVQAAAQGVEETVEDLKKKVEELQEKIKNKLQGK